MNWKFIFTYFTFEIMPNIIDENYRKPAAIEKTVVSGKSAIEGNMA